MTTYKKYSNDYKLKVIQKIQEENELVLLTQYNDLSYKEIAKLKEKWMTYDSSTYFLKKRLLKTKKNEWSIEINNVNNLLFFVLKNREDLLKMKNFLTGTKKIKLIYAYNPKTRKVISKNKINKQLFNDASLNSQLNFSNLSLIRTLHNIS
jgi:hypothetical protein